MKKRRLIFLVIVIFLIIIGAGILIKTTGKAIQSIAMNISVTGPPALTLISPENETYLTNTSILLNYSVSDEDWVKYSLDSGNNITVTSSIFFNASEGSHTLYLYANNNKGLRTRSVNFSVDSTVFKIDYGEWKNSKKGDSTNFSIHPYKDLQNLSEIILENAEYGKMEFNENINLTDDENPLDNMINISANTNVSWNRIEINSTALPNFNKSTTLWLYNLTFDTPRILRDGEVCPSSVCTQEDYSGGTLRFNVTGFTVYSAEETPVGTSPPGGGNGGGGGGRTKKTTFTTDIEIIKVTVKKGETFKSIIKIKNTENSIQNFNIEAITLQDFIVLPEKKFSLKAQEEKEIIIIFSVPEDMREDTYTGTFKISTAKSQKEIPVILGVKSKISLFDITLIIPLAYKDLMPGEDVLFQISLFNLGEIGKVDVKINYAIKDLYGNTITEAEGIVAVETQASFSRSIRLPSNLAEGQYVAIANVKYDSSVGTSSDIFYVNKKKIGLSTIYIIAIILGILCFVISTFLIIWHFNKKVKEISKIQKKNLNKTEKQSPKKEHKISKKTAAKKRKKSSEKTKGAELVKKAIYDLNREIKKISQNKDSSKSES